RRSLAARELARLLVRRQLEPVHELGRELGIPARSHARGVVKDARDLLVEEVAALADEAHAGHDAGVLVGVLAIDPDRPCRGPAVRGDRREQRGLARAVAAEQAIDDAWLQVEADLVDGGGPSVPHGEVADLDGVAHDCSPCCSWSGSTAESVVGRVGRAPGAGVGGGGAGAEAGAAAGAASNRSRKRATTSSTPIPSTRASVATGSTTSAKKFARRRSSSPSRAPGATNMPRPRRL